MQTLIDHSGWYSFCWMAFYVTFGIFCYILDRMYMPRFFTWWYNMFHEKERQLVKPIGFIYGHRTAYKFVFATIVSTVQSLTLFFWSQFHSNPFVELVLWFFEIPAMVLGFVAGYWLYPVWEKRFVLYKAADLLDKKVEERHQKQEEAKADPALETKPVVETPKPTAAPVQAESAPMPVETPESRAKAARERLKKYASTGSN